MHPFAPPEAGLTPLINHAAFVDTIQRRVPEDIRDEIAAEVCELVRLPGSGEGGQMIISVMATDTTASAIVPTVLVEEQIENHVGVANSVQNWGFNITNTVTGELNNGDEFTELFTFNIQLSRPPPIGIPRQYAENDVDSGISRRNSIRTCSSRLQLKESSPTFPLPERPTWMSCGA